MTNNIRTFKKVVENMTQGEPIFLNTINFSLSMIDQLRTYIENGTLVLDEKELDCMIVENAKDAFRSGRSICPQMTYIKA